MCIKTLHFLPVLTEYEPKWFQLHLGYNVISIASDVTKNSTYLLRDLLIDTYLLSHWLCTHSSNLYVDYPRYCFKHIVQFE